MGLSRLTALMAVLSLAACGVETVVQDLNEREANQIIEVLADNGITADKLRLAEGREVVYAVNVPASVRLDDAGQCAAARIALLSVGDRPMLAEQACRSLTGHAPGAQSIRAAAHAASTADIDPPSDIHASARYRRQLANVLTRRALERAFERAALSR